jgi:hypothetical protein
MVKFNLCKVDLTAWMRPRTRPRLVCPTITFFLFPAPSGWEKCNGTGKEPLGEHSLRSSKTHKDGKIGINARSFREKVMPLESTNSCPVGVSPAGEFNVVVGRRRKVQLCKRRWETEELLKPSQSPLYARN